MAPRPPACLSAERGAVIESAGDGRSSTRSCAAAANRRRILILAPCRRRRVAIGHNSPTPVMGMLCGPSEMPNQGASGSLAVRKDWMAQVGRPSGLSFHVNARIHENGSKSITHQLKGSVSIPSEPVGEGERLHLLSTVLEHTSATPGVRAHIIEWHTRTEPAEGVSIHFHRAIPTLGPDDIISVERTDPAEMSPSFDEELMPAGRNAMSARWYKGNRYLANESREQLIARLDDVERNIVSLSSDGVVVPSSNQSWEHFRNHLMVESQLRGYPLSHASNRAYGTHGRGRFRFWNGELCSRAAKAVNGQTIPKGWFVKYGKERHMRALFERGDIRIAQASEYASDEHNVAIKDNERELEVRGFFVTGEGTISTPNGDAPPVGFATMYGLMERHESHELGHDGHDFQGRYESLILGYDGDYHLCCLANRLAPELFSDFDADACVMFDVGKFSERIIAKARHARPMAKASAGFVRYQDPLGLLGRWFFDLANPPSITMRKPFGFAYQQEWRIVWESAGPDEPMPNSPMHLNIGSMKDYAMLLTLD